VTKREADVKQKSENTSALSSVRLLTDEDKPGRM